MRSPTPTPMRRPGPRGVTLIELMMAIVLFVLVFGLAVPFFRFQARSVSATSGRLDALQNARYAQNAVDRELRMAGAGIVSTQPLIVQADKFAVTFNADLETADPNDMNATYYDPTVDSNATISLSTLTKITLPRTAKFYPDSNYLANSVPSRAETISFWVDLDTTSGRSDQYILYRRVNNMPPRIVAKGLIIATGKPFFTYFRPDTLGRLDSIKTANLPLYHTAPLHGSPQDTGKLAWVDSIRVVRVGAAGLYHDATKGDIIRSVSSSTKLINAGMVGAKVCGDLPLPPGAVGAVAVPAVNPTKVTLTWTASVDQDNGEKDVERYMVFKRLVGDPDWGEPRASLSASQPAYTFDDADLHSGTWVWAVIAQDCSPSNSSLTSTNTITIP